MECCFKDLLNIARSILVLLPSSLFLCAFMWCICTVVLIELLLGRNPVLGLVGLVSLFNGISTLCRIFNAKAILLEER